MRTFERIELDKNVTLKTKYMFDLEINKSLTVHCLVSIQSRPVATVSKNHHVPGVNKSEVQNARFVSIFLSLTLNPGKMYNTENAIVACK